jgi:hypothetical protein
MHVTKDVEDFYAESDPDKENLCLYGNPDGTWEVQLPAEEVPPELPEPALGINFARDGMQVRTPTMERNGVWKIFCASPFVFVAFSHHHPRPVPSLTLPPRPHSARTGSP